MPVFEQDSEPQEREPSTSPSNLGKAIAFLAVAIVASVVVYWGVSSMRAPEPTAPTPEPVQKAEPKPTPAAKPAEPVPEPEPARAGRPRPKKEKAPEPIVPAPAAPSGPTLVIDSDVPGASVFVNRQYLGTTPLTTSAVAPGRHQLNASAEGEDGIAQTIDVADSGETTVRLRFKEVRLDASIAVVHKHGMGGACEGRLLASPAGLRYDTSNPKDAFSLTFATLEVFEIDYLKKELKVKQRGGKTWNFTDKNDNADKLFVFHRDVTKAREKLKAQGQ